MEIQVEQRSAEWFDLRKKHIGGSDVAPILGISPWKSALDVFNEKISPHVEEAPRNPWMQRGVDLEPEALRAFENETGYLMSPKVMISDCSPFAIASFDGFDAMGDKRAVEIKCGGEKSHLQAIYGEIPKYYIAQMQHQMYVAELDEIYFCSYRPEYIEKPLYIDIIKRDEEFIASMIEAERRFYEEHMLTGIPPEKIERFKVIESAVWKDLTREYLRLDRQEKEASKRKEEIRDYLVQIAQQENARGNGITLQKIEKKGIIDYKNIPVLKTIDLEEYRRPGTTYWQVKEEHGYST
jgi:putative phage-type endonuclease